VQMHPCALEEQRNPPACAGKGRAAPPGGREPCPGRRVQAAPTTIHYRACSPRMESGVCRCTRAPLKSSAPLLRAQAKTLLHRLVGENRVLATEKRRMQEQLLKARCNVTKAEELLNSRERCGVRPPLCCSVPCHKQLRQGGWRRGLGAEWGPGWGAVVAAQICNRVPSSWVWVAVACSPQPSPLTPPPLLLEPTAQAEPDEPHASVALAVARLPPASCSS